MRSLNELAIIPILYCVVSMVVQYCYFDFVYYVYDFSSIRCALDWNWRNFSYLKSRWSPHCRSSNITYMSLNITKRNLHFKRYVVFTLYIPNRYHTIYIPNIYQIGTKSYELTRRETAQTVHIGIYLYAYFETSSGIFVYLVLRNYSNCVIQQLLIRHEKLYICDKMSHFQGRSGSAVPIKMC